MSASMSRVAVLELGDRLHVLLGDEQDVRRRLRVDVAERHDPVRLPHDVGGDLPRRDPAEDAAAVDHRAQRYTAQNSGRRKLARGGAVRFAGGLAAELGEPLQQPALLLARGRAA